MVRVQITQSKHLEEIIQIYRAVSLHVHDFHDPLDVLQTFLGQQRLVQNVTRVDKLFRCDHPTPIPIEKPKHSLQTAVVGVERIYHRSAHTE
jgi:hypothetical protein